MFPCQTPETSCNSSLPESALAISGLKYQVNIGSCRPSKERAIALHSKYQTLR
ncbi:hypothetical protein [Microcoleus anatoxicus]|uniref:hypothetical protein n=1 Tax=Microcoleus anatoxicus TaxID=2705319 RepID=UPI0030C92107